MKKNTIITLIIILVILFLAWMGSIHLRHRALVKEASLVSDVTAADSTDISADLSIPGPISSETAPDKSN